MSHETSRNNQSMDSSISGESGANRGPKLLTHNLDDPAGARDRGLAPHQSDPDRFGTKGDIYLVASDRRLSAEGTQLHFEERRGTGAAVETQRRGHIELSHSMLSGGRATIDAHVVTAELDRTGELDLRIIDAICAEARGVAADEIRITSEDPGIRVAVVDSGFEPEDRMLFLAELVENAGNAVGAAAAELGPIRRAADQQAVVEMGDALAKQLSDLVRVDGLSAVFEFNALSGELELTSDAAEREAEVLDALSTVSVRDVSAINIASKRGDVNIGHHLVGDIDWVGVRTLQGSVPRADSEIEGGAYEVTAAEVISKRIPRPLDDELRSLHRLDRIMKEVSRSIPSVEVVGVAEPNPVVEEMRGHPTDPPRQLRFAVRISETKQSEIWLPDEGDLDVPAIVEAVQELVELERLFPHVEIEALSFDYAHPSMPNGGPVDGYCGPDDTVIHLNADYAMAYRGDWRQEIDEEMREGGHFSHFDTSAIRATLTHEFWHRIEFYLEDHHPAELEVMRRELAKSLFGKDIAIDLVFPMRGYRPLPGQIPYLKTLAKDVSLYATTSKWELCAELFREWHCATEPRTAAQTFGTLVDALRSLEPLPLTKRLGVDEQVGELVPFPTTHRDDLTNPHRQSEEIAAAELGQLDI